VELRIQILEVKLAKVAFGFRSSTDGQYKNFLYVRFRALVRRTGKWCDVRRFRAFPCRPFRADGLEAGNHHSKDSSSCDIFLRLKPECRYSRRVRSGAGTEGRRKPESETSESGRLWARGWRSHARFRGRGEGVSVRRVGAGQDLRVPTGKLKY
jgi:hypothetical protein